MHIQIVTFQLQDLSEEDYLAAAETDAPTFASVPGLISKVWLHDPATGTFGGVKTWVDRAAMESYLKGDTWRSMVTDPHVKDVSSRDFEVLEAPTRLTRGLPAVTA